VGLRLPAVALLILLARGAAGEEPIYVARTAPFTHPDTMSQAIVAECEMPERQIAGLVAEAKAAGVDLVVSDDAAAAGKGRVLVVEIANAVDGADGYGGRQVALFGRLLQDGAKVGSFYARRTTNRGFFAGVPTTCAALHVCQDTLSHDIAVWLKSPTADARLGEH
jgi:hypothetical protein